MFCSKCGSENPDGAGFCAYCGNSLQGTPAPHANQRGVHAPVFMQMVYENCVSAAWHDIRSTPGWFKKLFLLCLLSFVPVLNFSVEGYALRWSREVSLGKRMCMPERLLEKRVFVTGLYAWLVRIALYAALFIVVCAVILLVTGLITVVSPATATMVANIMMQLSGLLAFLFFLPFVNVSIMHMAVSERLEAGFNLRNAWRAFRRGMGDAMGASILLPLVVGIASLFIAAFFIGVGNLVISTSVHSGNLNTADISSFAYSTPSFQMIFDWLRAIGLGMIPLAVAPIVLIAMLQTFSVLFVTRAMGHWAARKAPEWSSEGAGIASEQGRHTSNRANASHSSSDAQPAGQNASDSIPDRDGKTVQMDSDFDIPKPRAADRAAGLSLTRRANGKRYIFTSLPATIGKGGSADVCIEGAPSISRVHARISIVGESYVVEDLNSTNKTYLNGDYLEGGEIVALRDGDELSLANETFVVSIF